MSVTDPEVVRLLLSSQEQIRSEIGNLARVTAAQGAKLEALEGRVGEVQSSVSRIHTYTAECQARNGWESLREDLSEIRSTVLEHDRELAEGIGYRAGKAAVSRGYKDTPKHGHDTRSLTPTPAEGVSVTVAVRDPKLWAKIAGYTLVGGGAAVLVELLNRILGG